MNPNTLDKFHIRSDRNYSRRVDTSNQAPSITIPPDFWKSLCRVNIDDLKTLYSSFSDFISGANGYVSCYNPILSYCTGAHNNSALLGSDQQAKGAMYYIAPYLGKNKNHFYSLLEFFVAQYTTPIPIKVSTLTPLSKPITDTNGILSDP